MRLFDGDTSIKQCKKEKTKKRKEKNTCTDLYELKIAFFKDCLNLTRLPLNLTVTRKTLKRFFDIISKKTAPLKRILKLPQMN